MGMRSSRELGRAIMGSVSASVLRRATHPVLIVPEQAQYKGIKQIAYATNFEEDDFQAIDRLMEFAFLSDAVIHCIHIRQGVESPEARLCRKRLKERYQDDIILNQIDFTTIDHPDVIEGLGQYAHEHQIDMLAMLTHKRGFWGQLFTESTSKRMALNTDIPLLVFHTGEAT